MYIKFLFYTPRTELIRRDNSLSKKHVTRILKYTQKFISSIKFTYTPILPFLDSGKRNSKM